MSVATSPFPSPPGFDLLGEIGRGGMGVVYRARDTAFRRDVAIKVLLAEPESAAAQRFADEARITAQLQHPGIPAVHQTGTLPDGRPYLVMKLIQGRTLAALLKEKGHGAVQWLGGFEGICQAVGAAHANGVIHRDLKPANVMVGAFGEVQVMDWGLAKQVSIDRLDGQSAQVGPLRERSDTSTVMLPPAVPSPSALTRSLASDGQSVTRSLASGGDTDRGGAASTPSGTSQGTILGTPAYMSPEQARGEVDRLDCRTDVFALGAILCQLLTGSPPLTGRVAEVLTDAGAGRFADAIIRLDGCGEDPALIALAKRCLSPNPADRPSDASAVAVAVAQFRSEAELRAKRAEVERAEASVQAAEQRKRRRVQGWLGGIAVALLLAGVIGTGAGLLQAESRRVEADEARGREKDRADAAEEARAAERRAKEDVTRAKEELQNANNNLTNANATAQAAREVSQKAEEAAFEILVEGTNDAVRNLIGSKPGLGKQESAYLEGMVKRWRTFADRTGDDDRSRVVRATAHQQLGLLWGKLGRHDRAEVDFRTACDLLEKLAAERPERRGVLVGCLHNLALTERAQFKMKEAEKRLRLVLDLLGPNGPWGGQVPNGLALSASTHIDLGSVLDESGRQKDAETEYRTGLKECDQLLAANPNDRGTRVTRGSGLMNLGLLLGDTARPREAEEKLREAVGQYAALAEAEPGSPHHRASLASVHTYLGQLLRVRREFGEAEAELRAGLDILTTLAADYPAVPTFRSELAITHGHLGLLLADRKKVDAAATEYKSAVALQEKLIAEQPKASTFRVEMAGTCCNLGELLRANGRPNDSLEWFDKAVKELTPLVRDANEDPLAKQFLLNSHWRRALAHRLMGAHGEAVADWDRVLVLADPSGRLPFRAERTASLVAAGRVSDAVAEADALVKRAGWSGDQLVQFAGVYSVASASDKEKADEYASRAVGLLTEATKNGFKDASRLKADKRFEPLRDREDFKKLLTGLEKDAQPRKEAAPTPQPKK